MVRFLAVISVLVMAGVARADCPQEYGGAEYDATSGKVRWCHDGTTVAGTQLAPGELARCDWTFAWPGSAPVTVSEVNPTPGTVYTVNVSSASGLGSIRGRCFNVYGQAGPEEGPVTTRFPLGIPAAPAVVQ